MKAAALESNIQAGLKEWIGLAVLSLPAILISVDLSVMILALPHISIALGADSTESYGSWTYTASCSQGF